MSYLPESGSPPPMRPAPVAGAGLIRTMWVLLTLMFLLLLPYLAEEVEYAITRGRQRAEAETAKGQLAEMPEKTSVYRAVSKAIEPSVVGVVTVGRGRRGGDELADLFGHRARQRTEGLGSGVIVDPEGYIVTNAHVISGASRITVQLSDGRTIDRVRVVGGDPLTDIAVLKINSNGLTAAPWGDSNTLEVGDPVLAIGNPYGLSRTVTAGIISAKERRGMPVQTIYQDFLQTDAAVNPGNSGGPLVNMRAQVVGINTAIVGEAYQGISFAIPSNVARNVYQRLRETGKISHGWLGISMQTLDENLARRLGLKDTQGALAADVLPNSPAQAAGVQQGDVVVEFNGKPVKDRSDLIVMVANTEVGSKAKLVVIRDGKRQELTVTIGERPAAMEPQAGKEE